MVTREAGKDQVIQGLGSYTKDSGFYPKGKGYEQGRDMTRLVFQKDNSCVQNTLQEAGRRGSNKLGFGSWLEAQW